MGKSIRYSASYKADAVDLVRQRGKSIGQIARDLGIGDQTLRNWVAQADTQSGSGLSGDLNSTERDELKRLRRENATLLMEREILKKRPPSSRRKPGEPVWVHRCGEGHLSGEDPVPGAAGVPRGLLCVASATAQCPCRPR